MRTAVLGCPRLRTAEDSRGRFSTKKGRSWKKNELLTGCHTCFSMGPSERNWWPCRPHSSKSRIGQQRALGNNRFEQEKSHTKVLSCPRLGLISCLGPRTALAPSVARHRLCPPPCTAQTAARASAKKRTMDARATHVVPSIACKPFRARLPPECRLQLWQQRCSYSR